MVDVELLYEKTFSQVEHEIVEKFVEFQHALIDANVEKLNGILLDNFEATQIPSKSQTKSEFLSDLTDGSLDFSKSDIMEPTILFGDDKSASLIAKVRLTAKLNGKELRWISNTVANFEKLDEIWYLEKWDY